MNRLEPSQGDKESSDWFAALQSLISFKRRGVNKGLISEFHRLISGLHWPQAVRLSFPGLLSFARASDAGQGLEYSTYSVLNFIYCGKTAGVRANIW